MNHAFRALAVFASFTALALTGCSPPARPARARFPVPEPPIVSHASAGRYGGQLMLTCLGDPRTFNPILANDATSVEICQWLFSPLVRMNFATQELEPALAASWSVAADQKTWTIRLRRGVRWSDGNALTAEDVVFTWNDIIYNPKIPSLPAELFRVDGKPFTVTMLDEITVQIVTPEPFAPLVEFLSLTPVLPRHVLEPLVKAGQFGNAFAPDSRPDQVVGCGPFTLKQHRPGRFVVLERNPDFWMSNTNGGRLPYFAHVIYTMTDESGDATALLRKGECQVLNRVRPEEYETLKQHAGNRYELVNAGAGLDREFVWFNQNTGTNTQNGQPFVEPGKLRWFRNQKFRQAVSCAVNRERIAREVYGGRAVVNDGFIAEENLRWYNSNVPHFNYDLPRARQLLADIGLKDRNGDGMVEDESGQPIQFTFNTNAGNPARQKTAQLIQEDLQKLGLRADLQLVQFPALVEMINTTFNYDCILMGIGGGGLDPTSQMNVLLSNDALHQWFPLQPRPSTEWEARIDTLMVTQLHTLDFAARKRAYDEVQVILAEQMPMIFTVTPYAYAAVSPKVGNLRPSAVTPYRATWNLEELYYK